MGVFYFMKIDREYYKKCQFRLGGFCRISLYDCGENCEPMNFMLKYYAS